MPSITDYAYNLDECNIIYLFAMRHGHETCKIVDWQLSQSQAEKLGQDVTNMVWSRACLHRSKRGCYIYLHEAHGIGHR